MKKLTQEEFYGRGGTWLGKARTWIQRFCKHGDLVTWGSEEVLIPHLRVKDVEEVAKRAAYAQYLKDCVKNGEIDKSVVLNCARRIIIDTIKEL